MPVAFVMILEAVNVTKNGGTMTARRPDFPARSGLEVYPGNATSPTHFGQGRF